MDKESSLQQTAVCPFRILTQLYQYHSAVGDCLPKTNAGCILSRDERYPMFRMQRRAIPEGKLLPAVWRDCDVR